MPIYRITDINLTHVPTVQVSRCFLLKKKISLPMSIPATRIDCPEDIFKKKKDLHDFSFDFNVNVYVCNNDNTTFTISEILTIFEIFLPIVWIEHATC